MHNRKKQTILIIATGGTIAGVAGNPQEAQHYEAGVLDIAVLVKDLPVGTLLGDSVQLRCEQLFNIDSKDMDFSHWQRLWQACQEALQDAAIDAIVITHGTDTIEETAYFLSRTLAHNKPIVLTCAMRPANAPDADGPANLQQSLRVAQQAMDAQLSGVVLAAAGKVWAASEVEKVHPRDIDAFDVRSMPNRTEVLTENDRLKCAFRAMNLPAQEQIPLLDIQYWPWVEVLYSYSGVSHQTVPALVVAGVKGIVIAATGNGTVHERLEKALIQAQEQGVCIWRSTRCSQGLLEQDRMARFPSWDLNPVKTRVEMILHLMALNHKAEWA